MMSKTFRKDLTDKKFGRLTVVEFSVDSKPRGRWLCRCDCGNTSIVETNNLTSGHTRSCGCFQQETRGVNGKKNIIHNAAGAPEYNSWLAMNQRCNYTKSKDHKNYGGRGIKVCSRWSEPKYGFVNFLADMGERPEGTTLDRIDVNGGYTPENCRWATMVQQANNRRTNKYITYKGETMTYTEWSLRLGGGRDLIRSRVVRMHWDPIRAVTTPVRT